MNRLLLYVHYNKYNKISEHVFYQLNKMRPLFSKVIVISNSKLNDDNINELKEKCLVTDVLERENIGYDFAAWKDGLDYLGIDSLEQYDSITMMNDTCFGPLWDLKDVYEKFESQNDVDFWGMTNHQKIKSKDINIPEHLQSYFISFKKAIISSEVFKKFWRNIEYHTDVQKVIDLYETQYTKLFQKNGFNYASVLDVVPLRNDYFHSNFTIHYPHVLLKNHVPFIKVKTFDLSRHLSPYLLKEIEKTTDYPIDLILKHMSDISLPTPPYLLDRKVVMPTDLVEDVKGKVAIHLHAFYIDLVPQFLSIFKTYRFSYDLFITTDSEQKVEKISDILSEFQLKSKIIVTGKKGRDIIPMLKLKDQLSSYDFIGHFHTKKSPEYPNWVGDSWREELFEMLLKPANNILKNMDENPDLGLVIADIPTFFRYTKIVDPVNENRFADGMNDLWSRMNLSRDIDFNELSTFIMSYGTFIWFRYQALEQLFNIDFLEEEVPSEPLPQHTILHSIERILVYVAWSNSYDYAISKNSIYITPFVDGMVFNIRPDVLPNTYVDFDHIGGIKGALKYIIMGPGSAIKYIFRRILNHKIKK